MCDRATLPPSTSAPSQAELHTVLPRPPRAAQPRPGAVTGFLDGFPNADDAVLLISELAANACAHSASGQPGGTFIVRAHLYGTYLHAEVEDQGSDWDGHLHHAENPHGLYLLATLSASCGALPGTHGWVTWFTLTSGPAPACPERNMPDEQPRPAPRR